MKIDRSSFFAYKEEYFNESDIMKSSQNWQEFIEQIDAYLNFQFDEKVKDFSLIDLYMAALAIFLFLYTSWQHTWEIVLNEIH